MILCDAIDDLNHEIINKCNSLTPKVISGFLLLSPFMTKQSGVQLPTITFLI